MLPGVLLATLLLAVPSPVVWYTFDQPQIGADSRGQHPLQLVADRAPGAVGQALRLGGSGFQLPGALAPADAGFAFSAWMRCDQVDQNVTIAAQDDAWLLRLDPPSENGAGRLSFFVNANGALEPRVRGPLLQPGTWYQITASWDQDYATLWVNSHSWSQRRAGAVPASPAPIVVGGPSKYGPSGLRGLIDEVRLYDGGLTEAAVLESVYDLSGPGDGRREARFEFAALDGWTARPPATATVVDGQLRAAVDGEGGLLRRSGLAVPVAGQRYLALRLSVDRGARGKLLVRSDAGLQVESFELVADGRPHSYVFDTYQWSDFAGSVQALGLVPSDVAATVAVDFVRFAPTPEAPPEVRLERLLPAAVIPRAGRPEGITVQLRNTGGPGRGLSAVLRGPALSVPRATLELPELSFGQALPLRWEVTAARAGTLPLSCQVSGAGSSSSSLSASIRFAPFVAPTVADYVPPPQPVDTGPYLVGAMHCPLWRQGTRGQGGWQEILPFPEREPALGWYDEGDPEVTDWELKFALDHGINYFVYCWYRTSQGRPVEQMLGHAIHDGLLKSRYGQQFKFAIMWENQSRGRAGVADEADLLQNLLPFWIENYFRQPNYLTFNGQPLLYIYRPEQLVDDLGSVEKVRQALEKVRAAMRAAGFPGVILLGEYRGTAPAPLELMKAEGIDCAFAYCWGGGADPTDDQAIAAQQGVWQERRKLGVLPEIMTVSMGWDSTPWHPSFTRWHLQPGRFQELCERAKVHLAGEPAGSLQSRMVLLDNWNEFGEGHYVAPHREHGFGYLDAVRAAFAPQAAPHVDLVPQDVGHGPYDALFENYRRVLAGARQQVTAPGGQQPGLLGWWTFNDPADAPYALDYTGHGLGGVLRGATRVAGRRGQALLCDGGAVSVERQPGWAPGSAISVLAWLRPSAADQNDTWFVNCIYGNGLGGFRFGCAQGRLSFALPKQAWSHHVRAETPLPAGDWIHVAATYDGTTIRVYQAGRQVAQAPRGGPLLKPLGALTLGNFDPRHPAHFRGLLDDVQIWNRALSAAEIAALAQ
ncbi:MAG: glycoside hydrolase family 99-like domain-containing protein [Fimbriimonadaceae bacterium]|nr:glycoside hydrolase family 99-like domain-containing protein [Fimbriimonadaceae bacterium]